MPWTTARTATRAAARRASRAAVGLLSRGNPRVGSNGYLRAGCRRVVLRLVGFAPTAQSPSCWVPRGCYCAGGGEILLARVMAAVFAQERIAACAEAGLMLRWRVRVVVLQADPALLTCCPPPQRPSSQRPTRRITPILKRSSAHRRHIVVVRTWRICCAGSTFVAVLVSKRWRQARPGLHRQGEYWCEASRSGESSAEVVSTRKPRCRVQVGSG